MIVTMRGWPKSKFKLTQRVRQFISERLLCQALIRRESSRFWAQLAEEADHMLLPFDGDRNALPKEVELDLRSVVVSDIYFAEEFDAAERGLRRLLSKAQGRGFPQHSSAELRAFFERATSRTGAGGIWNLSGAQFKKINPFRGAHIEHVHFLLSSPAPSFVVLIALVTPSDSFRRSVSRLLSTDSYCDVDITHVRFRPFDLYFSSGSAVLRRQRELDELFLALNGQIVRGLRKLVKAGMAMEGPLPFIEIYDSNQPHSFFQQFQQKPRATLDSITRNAFRTLGLTEATYWHDAKFLLNQVRRDDYYKSVAWQIFLLKRDVDGDEKRPRFFYETFDLGPLIAIEHFHRITAQRAGALRKEIAALMNRSAPASPRRFLRHAWRLLPKARQTLYEQRRMSAELPDALPFLSRNVVHAIKRSSDHDNEIKTLVGDLRGYLSQFAEFTVQTLEDVSSALRDFTDAGNMAVSYKIQRNVTIIAVIALIAAILALDREKVMDWLLFLRRFIWKPSG